ncbi:sigma-70 family RNA polymerase sigma factor [Paramaledivibacter caminithermalis]|jgi:RNA polymerase sigma-70 factor (ECF subfamily)|uniref:RNA polymerase sigma-70 factor, ECF subfamily n=1 Tax=Paramaledivibacter caminithermalis (strain DSM 15212 / CIP 107654 / DViRD3) TaxID=1121301 RepID=A0A1M6MDA6_PARC5|nr:sigma-70 family RNA polymerase sigma factor [Paramaledivibacter caminithermalis]SHJ81430.1 RNA polymerase sigma-70 factor, ECF subfamily [Paramaledivibacter caminithermalis DSM 15212]
MIVKSKPQISENHNKNEALEYLMKRFGDKIIKLAYYYVRDRYQAEDIAQEVFCKVYENLDDFRGDSSYYTWIYKITVNKCRDYLASAKFKKLLFWDNIKKLDSLNNQSDVNRLFEEAEGGEVFSKVMDLPTKYRMVVVLYYFEEFTTVEIAGILNLKESTVRTRLCRAREKLKNILAEEAII